MGRAAEDTLAEDAAFWGIDPALLSKPQEDALWPDHIPALEAFLAVQTQWATVVYPMGQTLHHGLRYEGVEAGLRMAGIEVTPALWGQIRLIEAGAKEALNEV